MPAGISDVSLFLFLFVSMFVFLLILENSLPYQIMWVEAMAKLEGMETGDRERPWPQLVHGFKDLLQRLKVIFVSYFHLLLCLSFP